MSDFKLFFPITPSKVWVNFLIRQYKVLKNGDLQEKCKKCKACSGYENILLTLLCLPRNKGLAVSHSFKTPSPERLPLQKDPLSRKRLGLSPLPWRRSF